MVQEHPRSSLLQGAEPYLRWYASHNHTDPHAATAVRDALAAWDTAQHSGAAAGLTAAV
ncbi:hypothetical protein ACFWSF_34905 [Streptomyces sp. NPDC058611]|uniref:hypothetical protein n=1 Tax=unclassified Streptomyces TaxID=2593676 RepID=UPI0036681A64